MDKKLQFIFGIVILLSISLGIFIKSISSNQSENFEEFNLRFHTDSIFQMSRINFPIKGKSIDGFEKHNWSIKNWKFLSSPVTENDSIIAGYKHSLNKTDDEIIDKIWIENSGFKTERKFKRINGKWFLVYYDDINL